MTVTHQIVAAVVPPSTRSREARSPSGRLLSSAGLGVPAGNLSIGRGSHRLAGEARAPLVNTRTRRQVTSRPTRAVCYAIAGSAEREGSVPGVLDGIRVLD